jgi:hypothetical protein
MRLIDAVTTAELIEKKFNIPLAELVDVFAEIPTIDIKTEVAREIFAEIEMLMLDGKIGNVYPAKIINPNKYAELKNKYIGGVGE